MEASEEDWKNLIEILKRYDWEHILNNKDESEITDILIEAVEHAVKEGMKSISRDKRTHDNNGNEFSSKNLIPKTVRKLFRKKV